MRLSKRTWLEAFHYPHFTMLFQSLASMLVMLEGLSQFVPDLLVDTTGLAFTYPVAKLFTSSRILSYTHYPTISTDMLHRVIHRETQFNNDAFITSHPLLSLLKQLYNTPTHQNHHPATIAFSPYSTPLRAAAPISSSQTAPGRTITSFRFGASHTVKIVGSHHSELSIVYPPCDTTEHRSLSAQSTPNTTINNANSTNSSASSLKLPLRQRVILSVGQFRPEKNHVQQLYILRRLIDLGIPAGILPSR